MDRCKQVPQFWARCSESAKVENFAIDSRKSTCKHIKHRGIELFNRRPNCDAGMGTKLILMQLSLALAPRTKDEEEWARSEDGRLLEFKVGSSIQSPTSNISKIYAPESTFALWVKISFAKIAIFEYRTFFYKSLEKISFGYSFG